MSVTTFAIDAVSVRKHYFPTLNDFSGNSQPSATIVAEYISEEAARLTGWLLKESVPASGLVAGTAPYYQCAAQLRRMVALRCLEVMTGRFPELAKRLADESDAWRKELEADGSTFLGDDAVATLSLSDPDGPTTHIDEESLDVGDTTLASDVIPALRRSDVL